MGIRKPETQVETAATLGISQPYLSLLLGGHKPMSEEMKRRLCVLLSDKPSYTTAPAIQGSVVILMDVQIPFQDGEFILNVLDLADSWGVKQGISGGDFFNESAFSIFAHKPEDMIWAEEAEKAREVAEVMLKFIPQWTFLLGNHDAFLLKKLGHQFNHEALLRLAEMPRGCIATDYYWCLVKDAQGSEWRVSHPRSVSVLPTRVPARLADRYHQNIVSGHGHLAGVSCDFSGKHLCIDAGVACDISKLDYVMERDSVRPQPNQGAVILKEVEGRFIPYHLMPQWIDWDALRRAYPSE